MRWIDHYAYWGPDRRASRRSWRFWERRSRDDAAGDASLGVALRQLLLRSWEAESEENIAQFRNECEAVAALADDRGEPKVAQFLRATTKQLDLLDVSDRRSFMESAIQNARAMMGVNA